MTITAEGFAMLAAVTVLWLPSEAQRRPPTQQASYTGVDGSFRFLYPSDFQVCTAGKMEPCTIQSYIPPYEDDTVVCVVYPNRRYEGTNFGAAAFQVREIHAHQEAMTQDACVNRGRAEGVSTSPEFPISARNPQEIISGVGFAHGVTGGAAMNHSSSVNVYRTFHQSTCYELSLRESKANLGVTDPPMKTLSPGAQNEVDESLSRILHSFRFLK